MEAAAGELSDLRLGLMQNGALEPSRADHAIGFAAAPHQVVKSARGACAVGIDITDKIGERCEFQAFDESTAFADGFRKVEEADKRKIGCNFLNDAAGVVLTTIENDYELKFAVVFLLEIAAILAENRFDAVFLVVSGNKQEQARFAHVMLNSR